MKKKTISIILTLSLIFALAIPSFAAEVALAASNEDIDYIIGNAYESVDWDTWNAYKTQLHCHTTASDGASNIDATVEAYYAAGYDILALTDHMTLGVQWDQTPDVVSIMRLIKSERTGFARLTPLTSERRQEILDGVGRDGRGMLEVTTGIELNGAVPNNSHINGYFTDYGQGLIGIDGDYETPAREVDARGGITFLDHLGDYTKAHEDYSISHDDKFIRKFSKIFLEVDSCLGTGINSARDIQTAADRIIYDEILQVTIPRGVVPWSFSFSDSHSDTIDQIDRAFTVHMMPEQTVSALRKSMEDGTFFCVCRYARYEMGEDYEGVGTVPSVNKITVDEKEDTITLDVSNYNKVVWVADGVEIAKGTSIDIDDYSDKISCYVRAYVVGDGGVLYVQPFTITAPGTPILEDDVKPVYTYSNFFRDLVTFLDKYVFSKYSLIRAGWNWLDSDWGFTVEDLPFASK